MVTENQIHQKAFAFKNFINVGSSIIKILFRRFIS